MKEAFLMELENQINIHDIENKKEILEKYRKRYDFGLESGLTEEEIEKMLGTPEEIIAKYQQEDSSFEEEKDNKSKKKESSYEIDIQTISDDVYFVESKDDEVHVELENTDLNSYEIKKTNKILKVHFLKRKFFSLNRLKGGIVRVELPKDRLVDSISVSTTSGDINMLDINAGTLKVSMVNGDMKFDTIEAETFMCHLVSADAKGDTLLSKEAYIDTVSGDVKIDFAVAETAKIDTVSGDVEIIEGKIGSVSSTSVTGEIIINKNSAVKSMKNYVKGIFKNEK